jgi:hypothetical protein
LDIVHGKGEDKPPIQSHKVLRQKFRLVSIGEENHEIKEGRKLKKGAKIKLRALPTTVKIQIPYLVSFKLWFHHLWRDGSKP